ncbi:MAG: hypothetical protein DWQ04_10630 [Chloroflexi bacterium]|nr:MAG: hypothetical protein DWQ04_10630 [Chloroflexota bacterium]
MSTNRAYREGIRDKFDYVVTAPIEFYNENTDTLFTHAMVNYENFPGHSVYEVIDYPPSKWDTPYTKHFEIDGTQIDYLGIPTGDRYRPYVAKSMFESWDSVLARARRGAKTATWEANRAVVIYKGRKLGTRTCILAWISAGSMNMRQFILTILIISNIGAGIEVASDLDDAWMEIDIFTATDGLQSTLISGGDEPTEEADCDHCCHAGAHFAGVIFSPLTMPFVRSSSDTVFAHRPYFFPGRSPPTPPPNV